MSEEGKKNLRIQTEDLSEKSAKEMRFKKSEIFRVSGWMTGCGSFPFHTPLSVWYFWMVPGVQSEHDVQVVHGVVQRAHGLQIAIGARCTYSCRDYLTSFLTCTYNWKLSVAYPNNKTGYTILVIDRKAN